MFTDNAVILVDSDSIYFRMACVTTKQKEIRVGIDNTMREIQRNCGSDSFLVAIKGRGNFRKEIYPAYKGTRKEIEPDVKEALNYGHKYMVDKYSAIEADDMEADDLVAIWAAECRSVDQEYTVVGIDKDLLQIPGTHYNFVKKEITEVDEDTANLKLMLQCLTGDRSDNIPGIKGIGPKKAEKILHGVPMHRRWNRVRAAWRTNGAGNPDTSKRLLTMLTSWEELDDIKKQIEEHKSKEQASVHRDTED
jgi:DNA polymerase-1